MSDKNLFEKLRVCLLNSINLVLHESILRLMANRSLRVRSIHVSYLNTVLSASEKCAMIFSAARAFGSQEILTIIFVSYEDNAIF